MISKSKFFFFLALVLTFLSYFLLLSSTCFPPLPESNHPILLYSNQSHQDLRFVFQKALQKAHQSIFIVMFGLSDPSLLHVLKEKAKAPLEMKIFFDRRFSPSLTLENHKAFPIARKGLMHQKILVVDHKFVFLGSTNMTRNSLSMHDNLIVGIYSPSLASFLEEKAPFYSSFIETVVQQQKIELWLLPDLQQKALQHVIDLIRSAKKTLYVAMFTFTHPLLAHECIQAHKRGVNVKIVVDCQSGQGASSQTVKHLLKANVPVFFSQGVQLFHHKYALIDEQTLIFGSANWTRSAFKQNADSIVILHNLSPQQRKIFHHIARNTPLQRAQENSF